MPSKRGLKKMGIYFKKNRGKLANLQQKKKESIALNFKKKMGALL